MIRVLLADDHAAVRDGLAMILESAENVTVVGQAIDGRDAIRQAERLRPDVVIMDVQMPGTDGLTATAAIVAAELAPVLVLTTYDLDDYVFTALRHGAAGFLLKTAGAQELLEAVQRVAAGDAVLDPAVTTRVVAAMRERAEPIDHPAPPIAELPALTDREHQVLGALGAGLSNQQIAEKFTISITTAKTHVSRILAKLGVHSRVQAALLAQQHGSAPGTGVASTQPPERSASLDP